MNTRVQMQPSFQLGPEYEEDPLSLWLYGIATFILFTAAVASSFALYNKFCAKHNIKKEIKKRLRRTVGSQEVGENESLVGNS